MRCVVKLYGADPDGDRRYSPAQCSGSIPKVIQDARSQRTFPRPTWNDRTGLSEPRCGATHGCRMASAEK